MSETIDALAQKLITAIDTLSKPAAEIALEATRIEAYSFLASGVLKLFVAVFLFYIGKNLWRFYVNNSNNISQGIFGGIAYVISGLFALNGIWNLIDPWVWATIYRPELFLAKKVIGF